MTVRGLRAPDDYAAMNRIANASRVAMGDSFTTTDEEEPRITTTSADRFVPQRDVIVIELEGRLSGYAQLGIADDVGGVRVYEVVPILDPALDVETLYPPVLDLERHARAVAETGRAPGKVLQVYNGDADAALEHCVLSAGYTPVRHAYLMVRPNHDCRMRRCRMASTW